MLLDRLSRRPALVLLLLAVAVRGWDLGDPAIHYDEQWYLLVGDRMWHGAVPFVDLWDRKPVGLFLLYAAIRLLPGDGIIAYQIVALLFAAATACVVARGARVLGASRAGALAAGAAYLLYLELFNGRGGQSPVFYNLPVALAGLLTIGLPARAPPRVAWSGLLACLLAGVAIQIKYTAAVEGAFVGLAHLWASRRAGAGRLAGISALWAAAGLAPTLAAFGWYAAHGLGDAWWFANLVSIGLRAGYPAGQLAMRLLGIGAQLAPLAVAALLAWRWRGMAEAPAMRLAAGWMVAAVIGFLSVGAFFDHYALPLLPPLCLLAAPALGRSRRVAGLVLGVALAIGATEHAVAHCDRADVREVVAIVRADSAGRGCPWVFVGDTITYRLAGTCIPTRFAFPNLLAYATERGATGVDEEAEVRRILATRPPVIVTSDRRLSIWNIASLRAVKAALARDYRLVRQVPRSDWHTAVYLRRDLSDRPAR